MADLFKGKVNLTAIDYFIRYAYAEHNIPDDRVLAYDSNRLYYSGGSELEVFNIHDLSGFYNYILEAVNEEPSPKIILLVEELNETKRQQEIS